MITLEVNNFEQWRQSARQLLITGISPEQVCWQNQAQNSLFISDLNEALIDVAKSSTTSTKTNSSKQLTETVNVPKQLLSQLQQAACYVDHKSPLQKWAIFYSLLWRTVRVNRATLSLGSDNEVQTFAKMLKAVNRDQHKMKAFVRFKKIDAPLVSGNPNEEYFTAWFEPEHAIVESLAPFFVKRFTGMSWSILTPHGCAHWNQVDLKLSDGIARPSIAQDEYERFWQTYYCNIFNPSRLKENAMRSEMPKKYWQYLPEAQCIKDLSRNAATRSEAMQEKQLTEPERIRSKSAAITKTQDRLRQVNRV